MKNEEEKMKRPWLVGTKEKKEKWREKKGLVITISWLEATASLMQVTVPSATNAGSSPASIAVSVSIIAGAEAELRRWMD